MEQVIVKVPKGQRFVMVKKKPTRVWTILGKPPVDVKKFIPVHRVNAFVEDFVHDWNWEQGKLRYYSRICDSKEEGANLLLQY